MDTMSDLVARSECLDVLLRVWRAADQGDADLFAAGFAEDATMTSYSGAVTQGREAIGNLVRGAQHGRVSRHVPGATSFDLQGDSEVAATTVVTVFRSVGPIDRLPAPMQGPELVVEYEDQLCLTESGWRVAPRLV
jgi:uncharacterized protein (TIGR02246 family)